MITSNVDSSAVDQIMEIGGALNFLKHGALSEDVQQQQQLQDELQTRMNCMQHATTEGDVLSQSDDSDGEEMLVDVDTGLSYHCHCNRIKSNQVCHQWPGSTGMANKWRATE